MKQIVLYGKYGEGKFALVDDEVYEVLSKYRWRLSIDGYVRRDDFEIVKHEVSLNIRRLTILMHRQIMNCPKGMVVDHKNHNKLDNRKQNLRNCTKQQNAWNCKYGNGVSKFNGVTYCVLTRRWRAYITQDNKMIHLGYFRFELEAALMYDLVALFLRGEYACPNFL